MNIFALDMSPKSSAQMMLDQHVVKMPTESMQMMSTIATHLGIENAPYRPVMLNHPCTIWARQTSHNYQWLRKHCYFLCKEYTVRYGRKHKVEETLEEYADVFNQVEDILPSGPMPHGLTPFGIAMSDRYRIERMPSEDAFDFAIRSYRHYYMEGKWRRASWKTQEPDWWPKDHYLKKSFEVDDFNESITNRLSDVMKEMGL